MEGKSRQIGNAKIQKQSILLWKDIIKNKSNASADATAVEEFPVK